MLKKTKKNQIKAVRSIFLIVSGMVVLSSFTNVEEKGMDNIIEPILEYVGEVISEMSGIHEERKSILDQIATDVKKQLQKKEQVQLIYICTHNSRRSHMAQLWAQIAACYYGVDKVATFSGGTEATACNTRTAEALRRVGFSVVSTSENQNPVYMIQFSDDQPPMKTFSKIYNQGGNPTQEFIALMCCSQADMQCPVIDGASSRYAIHYEDPKEFDDTNEEMGAYDSRCQEIALEMFYLISRVSDR